MARFGFRLGVAIMWVCAGACSSSSLADAPTGGDAQNADATIIHVCADCDALVGLPDASVQDAATASR